MKRYIALLTALTAVFAAVMIPLDRSRAGQNETGVSRSSVASQDSAASSALETADIGEAESSASVTETVSPHEEKAEPGESADVVASRSTPAQPPQNYAAPQSPKPPASSNAPSRPSASSSSSSSSYSKPVQPLPKPPAASSSRPSLPKPESSRPSSASSKPSSSGTGSSAQSFAEQVVKLVNQERAKAGLSPLSISQPAASAALVRSKEIEGAFSHTRPNGSSFSTALTEQGVRYRSAGENIAWGQRTPEQVMEAWMNSAGHRANILNAKFTSIGVGCYRNASGVYYWTQLFIG